MEFVKETIAEHDYSDWSVDWFPAVSDLHKAGIEYTILDQQPGDLVASGGGGLHFVLKPVSCFSFCCECLFGDKTWSTRSKFDPFDPFDLVDWVDSVITLI